MENNLKKYQEKRDFTKTKEPKGRKHKSAPKLRFCIQHHLARKDHYDFRLEWNGVLKSWAVPKGPSYNPKDKRLAIMVEDHPFSYRTFEGTIPKGEYGGGTVMLWDEGYWEPTTKVNKSFKVDNLKFILKGKKLKGAWSLVKLENNNWLLIKEKDGITGYADIKKINTSIKTGRTMTDIANTDKVVINKVTITNPNKVIFKNPTLTKEDLVRYYKAVSTRMLPYLKNRIISTVRAPEGIDKEKFYKKHLETTNPGLGKVMLNDGDYYYIKNTTGLISEVQMNSYEFHIWGSKIKRLDNPDLMVFDLDPDEKLPLTKLRQGVKDLKKILDELHLKSFLKVSGGKGYHIVIPLKGKMTWEKLEETAQNIALLMEAKWPKRYTTNIRKKNRKGKIYIDWMRNIYGSTFVAPYSIRLRENCPVSFPISWRELDKIKPNEITLCVALKRLKKRDPWANFLK